MLFRTWDLDRPLHPESVSQLTRSQMELQMKAICEGRTSKYEVVETNLEKYREVYMRTQQQIEVLRTVRMIDLYSAFSVLDRNETQSTS